MWKAIADLGEGEVVLVTAGWYGDVLSKTRQWLAEQGEVWFDMQGLLPAHVMPTYEMEFLGIRFVEEEEEVV